MTRTRRIFFTGVPGSRWSGIAQTLEQLPGFNTSDRTPARTYSHGGFSGHVGVYFGQGMEFEPYLDADHIDSAWSQPGGTRMVKSHDWCSRLPEVAQSFPYDRIMLVYRPDLASYAWWHQAGGFDIKYPRYDHYRDSTTIMAAISQQNQQILSYAHDRDAQWNYFTRDWIHQNFGVPVSVPQTYPDILVALIPCRP